MRPAAVLVALLIAVPAHAADVGGRIKLDTIGYQARGGSIDAALGHRAAGELAAEARVNIKESRGPLKFDAAWVLNARHGSAVERDRAIAGSYPSLAATGVDDSFLDLDDTLVDGGATQVSQRLDRLSIAYLRGAFVTRIGRQALTWGSGLVFHPMDLVNPFQPVATDTAYKRGTDMAYAQWLLADGSDIQFAAVPHRHDGDTYPDAGEGTYAVFADIAGGSVQWSLLLARDRADTVLGAGASGALGGAVWNAEVVPTSTNADGTRTSALANLSYATTVFERNATLFAELYHNGFGETGSDYTAADLNADLSARLARGQVFVTGRDYLSLGATWEWTPLLQLMPTLILNLDDGSMLIDMQLSRSLGDNTALKAGLRLSAGRRGSEFTGLRTEPGGALYLSDPASAFVRLEYYF
ncbi:MAG: hypothetical protein WB783_14505 [Arenicellales bacterium]